MPVDEMTGVEMTEYTPESVREVAEVLAPQAGNYVNAITEQIGQAQRSMGKLAGQTMGSTTAGLGNYTYNRLVRPQVDAMRDEIIVEGYRNALNKMLYDALNNARSGYASRSSGTGTTGNTGTNDPTEKEVTGGGQSGYQHVGVADKETGGWIDEEASKKSIMNPEGKDVLSGQSAPIDSPVARAALRAALPIFGPWGALLGLIGTNN